MRGCMEKIPPPSIPHMPPPPVQPCATCAWSTRKLRRTVSLDTSMNVNMSSTVGSPLAGVGRRILQGK